MDNNQFEYQEVAVTEKKKHTDVCGIISMVLGILSLLSPLTFCCCTAYGAIFFTGFFGIAAIILALIGKAKNENSKFSVFGKIGLILGIVTVALVALVVIGYLLIIALGVGGGLLASLSEASGGYYYY